MAESVDEVGAARQHRWRDLLAASLEVTSGIDLGQTLQRIVRSAVELVGARYGALGVLGPDGSLREFHHVGIPDQTAETIGALPTGKGVLGLVIERNTTVRLADLAAHPASVGFPPGHPPMHSFLGVPVRVRGRTFGQLYLTERRDGAEFTSDDEAVAQSLAAAAGVAVENAQLFGQVRQRERWLSAISEITVQLLGEIDVPAATQLVAARAQQLMAADVTAVLTPVLSTDGRPAELEVVEVVAEEAAALVGLRVPITGSTSGSVFLDGSPRRVPSLAVSLSASGTPSLGPALVLPLGDLDGRSGVLVAARLAGAPAFDDDDLAVASSFADQASLVLQRAVDQLARQQLELVADQERIARDLHDHVIQRLFALGLGMQATLRLVTAPAAAARLETHVDELQAVITDIRAAIFGLQTGQHLGGARRVRLQELVDGMLPPEGLHASIRFSGDLDALPDEVVDHLEAVLREAISNVSRHAAASSITVDVSCAVGRLVVEVTDDGTGLPPVVHRSGLGNLAERAAALGGTFSLTSAESGGTRLVWSCPVRPPAARPAGSGT